MCGWFMWGRVFGNVSAEDQLGGGRGDLEVGSEQAGAGKIAISVGGGTERPGGETRERSCGSLGVGGRSGNAGQGVTGAGVARAEGGGGGRPPEDDEEPEVQTRTLEG